MVAQGQHVTVLGSNWASVELASYLSDVARKQGWGSKGSVTLIFPESTPLSREVGACAYAGPPAFSAVCSMDRSIHSP